MCIKDILKVETNDKNKHAITQFSSNKGDRGSSMFSPALKFLPLDNKLPRNPLLLLHSNVICKANKKDNI